MHVDAFLSLGLGLVAALASFFLQFPLLFLYVSCLPLATASSPPSSTSCSPPSVLVLKSSDATSGLVQPCLGLLELLPPPSSLPSAFLPRLPHFVATGRSPDDKQPQRLISGFFPAVVRPSGSTAPSPARDIWRLRTCCPACCQQPARRGGASCLSFFFLLFVGVRPFFLKK